MIRRLLNPLRTNSFFIFGPRGVGKSTLISQLFESVDLFELNLLDPETFNYASFSLAELAARIEAVSDEKWIFIDEVQKVPQLLDVVQKLIDQQKRRFILTGSSARKLKRGGANLLAGRAYTYNLHPLTAAELGTQFDLDTYLSFGGLPRIYNISDSKEHVTFLRSYAHTYLKEEIAEEQIVRKIEPFGRFLQVAAQSSGQVINFSNIAKDVGVSDQTVKTYFQILEDTLLGFKLPPFNYSVRKAQKKSPKFYLFDPGVIRTLRRTIDLPCTDRTYEYGDLFEHFVIHEIKRLAEYSGQDFEFSFLRINDDQEIDLIIDRPGKKLLAIEIKSTELVREEHTKNILKLGSDIKNCELIMLSRDPNKKKFGPLTCMPWKDGIDEIVGG